MGQLSQLSPKSQLQCFVVAGFQSFSLSKRLGVGNFNFKYILLDLFGSPLLQSP